MSVLIILSSLILMYSLPSNWCHLINVSLELHVTCPVCGARDMGPPPYRTYCVLLCGDTRCLL